MQITGKFFDIVTSKETLASGGASLKEGSLITRSGSNIIVMTKTDGTESVLGILARDVDASEYASANLEVDVIISGKVHVDALELGSLNLNTMITSTNKTLKDAINEKGIILVSE